MDISAKTALVTGGASGLGLATTTMLALAGARVVVIDLPSADQSLLNDIEGDVVFAPADVTAEDEVQRAVDIANENHDLAIVVNCAGMLNGFKTAGSK
ncbi:SDR family NAD(P)-dependent oxidoreductase, partial [Corynebacterium stationis]